MSTKIYNGYRLPGITTVFELQEFTRRLVKEIRVKQRELVAEMVAHELTTALDSLILRGVVPDEEIFRDTRLFWFGVQDHIKKRQAKVKATLQRDPSVDVDFSVCFVPAGDKFLSLLYTDNRELEALWNAQPEVLEYGYWNNTDQPDGVSDEEWEERCSDWRVALPGHSTPAENGFLLNMDSGYWLFPDSFEDVAAYLPSFDERICFEAKRMLLNSLMREELGGKEWDVSDAMDAYSRTSKRIEQDEDVQFLLEEKKRELRWLLPEHVTHDLARMSVAKIKEKAQRFASLDPFDSMSWQG